MEEGAFELTRKTESNSSDREGHMYIQTQQKVTGKQGFDTTLAFSV